MRHRAALAARTVGRSDDAVRRRRPRCLVHDALARGPGGCGRGLRCPKRRLRMQVGQAVVSTACAWLALTGFAAVLGVEVVAQDIGKTRDYRYLMGTSVEVEA